MDADPNETLLLAANKRLDTAYVPKASFGQTPTGKLPTLWPRRHSQCPPILCDDVSEAGIGRGRHFRQFSGGGVPDLYVRFHVWTRNSCELEALLSVTSLISLHSQVNRTLVLDGEFMRACHATQ